MASGATADWRDEVRRVWPPVGCARRPSAGAGAAAARDEDGDARRDAPLGHDPATRLPVFCYEGQYGPVVRLGTAGS